MNLEEIPEEKLNQLAYLAGILRDGSLPKPYNNEYEIQISQDNIEWLTSVKEMLEKLFQRPLKIVGNGKQTPRIKIYSKEIYFELVKLFEYPGSQSEWRIPSFVRNGSMETKRQFIRGFFEAEGEVPLSRYKNGTYKLWIRFHHSWNGMRCLVLEELKELLEKDFRINCRPVTNPKKEKNFPSFDLSIYREDVRRFMDVIRPIHPRHNERWNIMNGSSTAHSLVD